MQYLLMNQHQEVLEFQYDEELHHIEKINAVLHAEYAPIGIMDETGIISRKGFNQWWRKRAIPASRANIREVLDEMNMINLELLERCFGLSLSDQYWVKEKNSSVQWDSVNFFTNEFSEDMGKLLMGQKEYTDGIDMFSPDNSSDGNLRKKWKIIDGKRCLIKSGNTLNNQEPFNEIVSTVLYQRLLKEDEYVVYRLIEEKGISYSCCETMVNTDEELVPAYYIDQTKKLRGNDSLYEHYINACETLGIPEVRKKTNKMIVCDYILANYDRYYRNFGAIRNIMDLKWKRIAPIFDSGSSLWATTPTQLIGEAYKSKPFKSNADAQLDLVDDFSWIDQNQLIGFDQEIYQIFRMNPLMEEARIMAIIEQVNRRIETVLSKKVG